MNPVGRQNGPPDKQVKIVIYRYLFILILIQVNLVLSAQSNQKSIFVKPFTGKIVKDTSTIFPGSVEILSLPSNTKISEDWFSVAKGEITLYSTIKHDTMLFVQYRVLENPLFKPLYRLDTSQINRSKVNPFLAYQYSKEKQSAGLDLGSLDYRGSISRSILTGNNQDLSLNSNLNLQVSGMLDKETEIAAVITDNNIPIQPEGATRQIQEFDKIFIQIKRKTSALLAGDYEIGSTDSYFMRYYKKLRGATITNSLNPKKNMSLNSRGSFAISRGKFSRMNIQGIEANQGPYKLFGADGESFIIVLAGTEKVFLDGQPMQRGLQDDYVIDYNRGDITFTNKRMITKDSRIIIEFEYTVENYVRSLFTVSESFKINKTVFNLNLYTEQDSKTAQGSLKLSAAEKVALRQAGDSLSLAVIQSVDSSSTDPIKYRLVDTLGFTNVLVYDKNLKNTGYTASFSFLGSGNGNYILDSDAGVNGRVFKWVKPDGNLKKGSYEPVKQLIAPTLQQMATLGTHTDLSHNMNLNAELAISKFDKNRFSEINSEDDVGYAAKLQLNRSDTLSIKSRKWSLNSSVGYEYISKDFKPLNPFRAAEFNRDFNYTRFPLAEHWITGGLDLMNSTIFRSRYGFNHFEQLNFSKINRHELDLIFNKHDWTFIFSGSALNSKSTLEKSDFIRPKAELSRTFKTLSNLKVKAFIENETNERKDVQTDTLLGVSFKYLVLGASATLPYSQDQLTQLVYQHRTDYLPLKDKFYTQTEADQVSLENNIRINSSNNLIANVQYRKLNIVLPGINIRGSENYLVRVQHNYQAKKSNISNTLSYEISTGQEQKIDFYYQEVKAGEGQYEYNDYNNDGVKQLDEFEIAVNLENAKYIRLVLLSNEFIQTNNIEVNENLLLGFPDKWSSKKGIKAFLNKFSLNTSGQISRKLRSASFQQIWNPLSAYNENNQLALLNYFYNSVLYFNRGKAPYEIQIGWKGNANKQLLSSGLEGRYINEYFQYLRINILKYWIVEYRMGFGKSISEAALFKSKNYEINSVKAEPGVTWNVNSNTRLALKARYESSEDKDIQEPADFRLYQGTLEGKVNVNEKSVIGAKFAFSNVNFTGNVSSPLGFTLLQGLRDGKNYQWNLDLDYRITRKMYLNAGYEGRKLGDGKLIHVLRMQVKAEF